MTPNYQQVLKQALLLPVIDRRKLAEALLKADMSKSVMSEQDLRLLLWRKGKLLNISYTSPTPFKRIKATGKPASEMIIEDRR